MSDKEYMELTQEEREELMLERAKANHRKENPRLYAEYDMTRRYKRDFGKFNHKAMLYMANGEKIEEFLPNTFLKDIPEMMHNKHGFGFLNMEIYEVSYDGKRTLVRSGI